MISCGGGKLDQRVTLQSAQRVRDGAGASADSWADVVTVWARVQPLRGREYFAADQMQEAVDYRVTLRWRPGIERTMRVLWRDEALDIVSVIDVEAKRETLELMCVSGVRNALK